MAHRYDTGESYFYEPTDDRTLRNLFDERDPDVLEGLEYVETAERHRELFAGEVTTPTRLMLLMYVRSIGTCFRISTSGRANFAP